MGYYTFSPDTVESQYRYHAINSATCKRSNTGRLTEANQTTRKKWMLAARIAVSIREHAWEPLQHCCVGQPIINKPRPRRIVQRKYEVTHCNVGLYTATGVD